MHLVRFAPAVGGPAGKPLLLGTIEVAVIACGSTHRIGEVSLVSLDLLQADNIRLLSPHPLEEALGGGGTNAVEGEGNDAHIVGYKFQGTRYKENPGNGPTPSVLPCILYLVSCIFGYAH